MTEAVIPVEFFEGKEIRTIEHLNEIWIPIADIAKAWGVERSTPDKIIQRNEKAFEGLSATVLDVTSTPMKCLNERGLYLLMGRITASRLKNKDAQEAITRFQKWYPELIQKYRKGEMQIQSKLTKDPGEGWSSVAIGHINFAKQLAKDNPDMDPGMCLAIGLRQAERATGMDLSAYKKLIPPAPEHRQEEYITVKQIAHMIGGTAVEINRYLARIGFQYRGEDDKYYLTNKGAEYGRVFPGAFDSGHLGYFIKWKRSVIAAARIRQNYPVRIEE